MRTSQIKQQLHDYIETADNKKLKAIYTLLEDEITYTGKMSEEQLKELDRRMDEYENGIGRDYSFDETIAMARAAVKK